MSVQVSQAVQYPDPSAHSTIPNSVSHAARPVSFSRGPTEGMRAPPVAAFYPSHTRLGESPLYRPEDKTLHYIDVLGQNIHILSLSEKPYKLRTIECPEPITFMGFARSGVYIVCYFQGIATVNEKDGAWMVLKKIIPDEEKHLVRLNDGAIDSRGRLWFGSIDIPGA